MNREKDRRCGCGIPQWEYTCGLGGGVLAHDGDRTCSGEAAISPPVSPGPSAEVPALALLSCWWSSGILREASDRPQIARGTEWYWMARQTTTNNGMTLIYWEGTLQDLWHRQEGQSPYSIHPPTNGNVHVPNPKTSYAIALSISSQTFSQILSQISSFSYL